MTLMYFNTSPIKIHHLSSSESSEESGNHFFSASRNRTHSIVGPRETGVIVTTFSICVAARGERGWVARGGLECAHLLEALAVRSRPPRIFFRHQCLARGTRGKKKGGGEARGGRRERGPTPNAYFFFPHALCYNTFMYVKMYDVANWDRIFHLHATNLHTRRLQSGN